MKNLIILLLLLAVAGSAWGVDRNWTNGNGNRLWSTAANWSGSVIPTSADKAGIRNQAISGPIIQTGIAAVANQVVIGDFSSTNDTLTITGGTLTTSGTSPWVILGYGAANKGTITISGGTATLGGALYVGFGGTGTLTMTGGSITVAGACGIAQNTGSTGDAFLNGGTLTCNGTFAMTSGGGMDITTGKLVVNGDVRTNITTYINNGWMTSYGGAGTFNVDYNVTTPGKTTVTASQTLPLPGIATSPNPANAATGVSITTTLSWAAGSNATSHDVYFGTSSPGTFQGNQAATTFSPGTLAYSTTYYWRIDEKNATGTTTGNVWSFTTAAVPPPPGKATTPNPANSATNVSTTQDLSWAAGSGATSHDVYFGTASPGTFIGNQAGTTFDTGTMAASTIYYWRIDEKNANGTTTGDVWSFTTAAPPPPPGKATTPNPANGATGIATSATISWAAGSGATSHDVYFGTSSPGTFRGNQAVTTYSPGTLAFATTYYWRIDEKNGSGTTTGDVWSFTTATAVGVDRNWSDGGDHLWTTAANWSGGVVPTSADKAGIRGNWTATTGPHIASGTAVANQIVIGDFSSTGDNLTMTGGTLSTNSWVILGYGAANRGTITISAGTMTLGDTLYVGFSGIGAINMTGGSISVATTFGIAQNAGSTGDVSLDGGTISCGGLNMTTNGRLDITAGTLIVNGDAQAQINGYITSAWITAYGGSGTFTMDYGTTNPGKTTVTATASSLPGLATAPNPANGATGVSTTNDLGWTAGTGATSHDVYFGTSSPGTFRGNQAATTYDTGTMAQSTTYYWRIDEKNSFGTTTGTVWSFTTQGAVTVNRRKGPYLVYPGTNTQMKVMWQVDITAGCTIAWGTDTTYSMGSAGTTEYGTDHQHTYTITGLTPGTKYYYRVTAGSNNWTGNFNAAPAASATAVKFFMYGDTRTSGGSNNAICGRMLTTIGSDPAFQTMVLHAGDWVESDSEATYTSQWYNYSWTNIVNATANMPFMGCIGNHEGGATVWKKYHAYTFPSSRFYHSFDYGPVHVAVVDQYTTYTSGSAQYNWLVSDLSGSTKPFKIIVFHQPAWCSGGTHGNDTTAQTVIQPLAVQYGAQICLAGHNHYYSRAVNNGIHHVTSGAGGAPFYSASAGQPYVVTYTTNTLECVEIAINGNTLTGTARASGGAAIDTFTITH